MQPTKCCVNFRRFQALAAGHENLVRWTKIVLVYCERQEKCPDELGVWAPDNFGRIAADDRERVYQNWTGSLK